MELKKTRILSPRRTLISFLIICLCWSAFEIYRSINAYHNVDVLDTEIKEEVITENKNEEDPHKKALSRIIDFESLKKRNKDVIGWIYIPGTDIDEVVMQGDENMTYLRHGIDGNYLAAGQIFNDVRNHAFDDQYAILYGHNMSNGTRFAGVRRVFLNGKNSWDKFKKIYIYTPDKKIHVYIVFSANKIHSTDKLYDTQMIFDNSKQSQSNISEKLSYIKQTSVYWRDIDQKKIQENNKKIVMLSTCAGANTEWRNCIFGFESEIYDMG